jgi:succinate dehydrogenase/fumarate reductase cytochrome b subunit
MTPTRPLPDAASDRRLARVQAVSGLLFLAFVTVHLVNLMLAARGPAAYNGFQRALRPFYQFPPLELGLVVAPLLVHVAAGIRRLRRGPAPRDWRARLHRWSGIFLLVVIFGHIAAVRGSSLVFGVYPEFEGLELSMWLAPYLFYPYYAIFALAAVYHALNGAGMALGTLGIRVPRAARQGVGFWAPVSAGMVLALVGILGIGGWLYPLPDPSSTEVGRLAARLLGRSLSWPH